MDLVNDRFKANNATRFFPFLRPYLPLTKGDHQILLFKKMIRDLILDHEEDHDSDSQPRYAAQIGCRFHLRQKNLSQQRLH